MVAAWIAVAPGLPKVTAYLAGPRRRDLSFAYAI
jgi:hypothetical protein